MWIIDFGNLLTPFPRPKLVSNVILFSLV